MLTSASSKFKYIDIKINPEYYKCSLNVKTPRTQARIIDSVVKSESESPKHSNSTSLAKNGSDRKINQVNKTILLFNSL